MSRCRTAALLEPLEPRRLLVAFVVEGTDGNDAISVLVEKGLIQANVNGVITSGSDAAFDAIEVRGLKGDDQIGIFNNGDNELVVWGDDPDGIEAGNDAISLATGNLDFISSPATVHGGGGIDLLRLDDHSNNFSDAVTITDTSVTRAFFGGVTYSADVDSLLLLSTGRSSQIHVNGTSPSTVVQIDSGIGSDTINVNLTADGSPVVVLPSGEADFVNVSTGVGGGPAEVLFTDSLRMRQLSVGPGGRAIVAPGGGVVATMETLLINGTGQFDLTDGGAIIDWPAVNPIETVAGYVTSGYAGGAWDGGGAGGIVSSTAAGETNSGVGLAEATEVVTSFPATFMGQQIDNTSVLLTYTLYGDANLDRTVNLADFNRLAGNFGQSPRRWAQGDFDFSSTVDLGDFNRLAANFGASAVSAAELAHEHDEAEDEAALA